IGTEMQEQNAALSSKQSYNSIRKFRKTTHARRKTALVTFGPATQPCIHGRRSSLRNAFRSSPAGFGFSHRRRVWYGQEKSAPVKILGICAAVVIVVVVVASLLQRPKPSASGAIDEVTAVEIPNQNSVMVAINVSLKNTSEKPLWIQSMKAEIATADKTYSDDAAAAVDFERYYQALPALKEHAEAPLTLEEKVEAGAQAKGTMMVSFPVTLDAFNSRKSLTVTIWPDRQPLPLIFTK